MIKWINVLTFVFQVIDISDIPPESGLEWCHLLPNVNIRVLVCGGDGTIGWVLSAIERLKLDVSIYTQFHKLSFLPMK